LKLWIGNELLWIEIVPEAIQDARYNAEINGVKDKCQFIASAAEKILIPDSSNNNSITEQRLTDIWLVIVDPPREWLHSNVINRIAKLKQSNNFKLLYISCNPTTMARDIEMFDNLWFKLKSLQPVDMFPHTHHIETIWILL
jgi:23S rRNA (uracil1939-C5)-methyltransferase